MHDQISARTKSLMLEADEILIQFASDREKLLGLQ